MAKKYLLYIHSERFADEEQKSGLVNKLLADHYEEALPDRAKVPELATRTAEPARTMKPIKTRADAQKAVRAAENTCEHGAGPGLCKKRGCKNAPKSLK